MSDAEKNILENPSWRPTSVDWTPQEKEALLNRAQNMQERVIKLETKMEARDTEGIYKTLFCSTLAAFVVLAGSWVALALRPTGISRQEANDVVNNSSAIIILQHQQVELTAQMNTMANQLNTQNEELNNIKNSLNDLPPIIRTYIHVKPIQSQGGH
jgi:hypothetical protein